MLRRHVGGDLAKAGRTGLPVPSSRTRALHATRKPLSAKQFVASASVCPIAASAGVEPDLQSTSGRAQGCPTWLFPFQSNPRRMSFALEKWRWATLNPFRCSRTSTSLALSGEPRRSSGHATVIPPLSSLLLSTCHSACP